MSIPSDVLIKKFTALTATSTEGTMIRKVINMSAFSPSNNTNGRVTTTADTQRPSVAVKNEADDSDTESEVGPAIYPPVLENVEILGYIKDKNGIDYSRDIGRSTSIHDEVYFIFGDTFCKDSAGKSVGITSNTIAYVEDRANCLESEYREVFDDGMVKAFVPLNEEETRFEKENKNARIAFRMFGGVVDIVITGVVWFQKVIQYENGEEDYCGVAQAWLTTKSDGKIIVQRLPQCLFGPNEPRIGSFSTLYYKGYVYLWSHRPDRQIILARVDQYGTGLHDRYKYWSGKDWVRLWHDAIPVLHDVENGAIIHTDLFGKDKPFVFVGANNETDSMVQMGAATEVQGPFDLTAICIATGIDHDKKYKYCIYPHLFASNISKRELVVTWSEHWPGGVIAAKLKFKIDEVAAVKEAAARARAIEEQEARHLARIAEEQEAKNEARRLVRMAEEQEAEDELGYDSEKSNGRTSPTHFLFVQADREHRDDVSVLPYSPGKKNADLEEYNRPQTKEGALRRTPEERLHLEREAHLF